MPTKHQEQSYRTRGGLRYSCWDDILDESQGPLVDQAKMLVCDLKASGRKAFYESHADGYIRVFAAEPGTATHRERDRAVACWWKAQRDYKISKISGINDGWAIVHSGRHIGPPVHDTWYEGLHWAHEHATGIPNHREDD